MEKDPPAKFHYDLEACLSGFYGLHIRQSHERQVQVLQNHHLLHKNGSLMHEGLKDQAENFYKILLPLV
jgi:hypothetical protein